VNLRQKDHKNIPKKKNGDLRKRGERQIINAYAVTCVTLMVCQCNWKSRAREERERRGTVQYYG
jgi:hypothetical protein